MWIEKTKSGSLRAVERYLIDGKYKRVSVPISRDTAQARRAAQDALNEKLEAIIHPSDNKSLKSLTELYIAKKKCKESTRYVTGAALKKMMEILGDISFDAGQINRALLECSMPPQTINRYLKTLKAFLRWCYRYGYTSEDIASKIYPVPSETRETPSELKYLEPEELKAVLDQLVGIPYYLCKFLALTGCRIGEAAALTLEDIDGKYIHVTKTVNRTGVTSPKTRSSTRDIFIQEELADMLHEYKEWRLLYMMAHRIRTDLLFFTRSGSYMTSHALGWHLKDIPGKHIHPHIFRHTHTALMAEQGMSLEAISRRLGHEHDDITREVYFHVTEKQKEKDEAAIAKIRIL